MTLKNDHITPRYIRRSALSLCAAVMLLGAFSATASAAPTTVDVDMVVDIRAIAMPRLVENDDTPIQSAQSRITPSEAKAIARRHVPGAKFNDISRKGNVYRVRLLKDGRVVDVLVDATTGRVLN